MLEDSNHNVLRECQIFCFKHLKSSAFLFFNTNILLFIMIIMMTFIGELGFLFYLSVSSL